MGNGGTLLLLGADGFAGTHLRAAALAAGLRVVGADRGGEGSELRFDLLDPDSIAAAIRAASPDLIVNMAGAASVAASWREPSETFAANSLGVVNLLEAVREHAPGAHLTCVSSAEVYGEATEAKLPFHEGLPMEPVTPYGVSKAAMELACAQYARSHRLRIAVVRAFNQLGPGQSPQFAAAGFARQLAIAELDGVEEAVLTVGNLSAARDFTDIRDSARAYLSVAEHALTGTFNLCTGEATRLETVIEELRAKTPLRVRIESSAELARPNDPPLVFGTAERLREATGWAPRIPLAQTIADVLDWWRQELGASDRADRPREAR